MPKYSRKRSNIHLPITLSATLMALNVTLMVIWIVLLARENQLTALTIGTVMFSLILVGMTFWLVLSIKEVRLNHRQANFVDSVTHELKSPLSAVQLYLETLRMRSLTDEQRDEFHAVMESELHRLEQLINQLLEVGRLDAVGQQEAEENVELMPLLTSCAAAACAHHQQVIEQVFSISGPPVMLHGRRLVLQMIFSNLIENAVKYGAAEPQVNIEIVPHGRRVRIHITNNGMGIAAGDRKKIFSIFYRGGSELERRTTGTGLGLYIVQTLVKKMHGRISVHDRYDCESGCTFELDLNGEVVDERTPHDPKQQPVESDSTNVRIVS